MAASLKKPSDIPTDLAPPVPIKKKPYPFILGGLAATIAATITHPLDLTKVRLQAAKSKQSMISSIGQTYRAGGVLGLWDGVSGTWMRQLSYSVCRFWAYDESKKMIGAGKDSPAWKLATAGAMAGGIAGFIGNPGEIVMVRLQGDAAKPLAERYNYKNCFDALFTMVRNEGSSSLMRGVGPNVVRAILMNASQLASYDFFKAELLKTPYFNDNIGLHFTASFAAGTVATTVCSPADVIKSRIMNASGSSSTLEAIRTAMKNEGPAFMFRGWLPAWTRLQPTTILIFLTLEQLKNGVDLYREKFGTD